MTIVGAESILTTTNVAGVWFGWVAGQNEPGWTIADNNLGSYRSLNARFVSGSDDWSAYMSDNARYAVMNFNETTCSLTVTNNSCYGDNGTLGVSL